MKSRDETTSCENGVDGSELPLTQALRGLSEGDAQARLRAEGPNELPLHDRRSLLRIVFNVVREPMLTLLIIGGLLYLALGSLSEAVVLLADRIHGHGRLAHIAGACPDAPPRCH